MAGDKLIQYIGRKDTPLAFMLNTIFDGVYIVNRKREIIFWNKGAEEITGYKYGEVCGRRCSYDILNHIDENGKLLCKENCPLSKTFETGKHVRIKVYPLHKSGRRFPVMMHIAPVRDKDKNIIAAIEVFRDISKEEDYRILQEKFNNLIRKYVSSATFKDVMERLKSDVKSDARIRDLTVLYLDVAGFTGFSEKNPPLKAARMLNEVFGICGVITKECHGDIDKFIGDALMAVFVDANDAVCAGVKILEALSKLNRKRSEKGKEPINVRIGINSGNVIQGDIGTFERKDLTVIGDVVNTTSRIQGIGDINSIFISEAAYSRLKNPEIFKFHKKVAIRGKKHRIPVFRYTKYSNG
ncbi:MAG: adenylate/guanylate cyclase domain-containing protein [bacterium]